MLLEDAFVLRDPRALMSLFEAEARIVADGAEGEVRGSGEIAVLATGLWARDITYVARPSRVVQARDIALVLATQGTSVVRRGRDGGWRYLISVLDIDRQEEEQ